jgi:hypothetical protein
VVDQRILIHGPTDQVHPDGEARKAIAIAGERDVSTKMGQFR